MSPMPDRPTNGCDVLVVEDDEPLNELVGAYVEMADCEYRKAFDGAGALKVAGERPPRLILLDLMLPDIDGFEVCRRLKASPSTASVPVVMLTALSGDDSRR